MSKKTDLKIDFGDLKEVFKHLSEMCKEKKDEQEWSLKITRVINGYRLDGKPLYFKAVIEDSKEDELESHMELLWEVMEYFNFVGSKHDPQRIKVIREKQK